MTGNQIAAVTATGKNSHTLRLRNQRPTIFIDNLNKSLKLPNINLAGVLAEPVQLGDPAKIWTKLAITSDEPPFHRIVESLSQVISHNAQAMGARISLNQANNVLLVIHSDDSADLWVDAAAVSICAILKRDIVPGSAVFESDIADVTGITFPAISILPSDRMVYLFRENWRFGLFFDLRTDTDLSVDDVASKLGYLYRVMRYSHLYEMLENETTFGSLIKTGWFPFAEIIGTEFDSLLYASKAGFDLAGVELDLISNFSETRLDHMFARWITKPHFAIKKPILKSR